MRHKQHLLPFIGLVLSAATLCHAESRLTAVRFGRLVTGDGRVVEQPVVMVDGDKILRVDAGRATLPSDAKQIDLTHYTGMPGLIDVHTHMTYYWDQAPGTRPWQQLSDASTPMLVFLAQANARKTLEAGVTTVRDLGSGEFADVAMRDLINRGAMIGPRMFVAGHGLFASTRPRKPGVHILEPNEADGPSEVMRVVRQQVAANVDVIKMYGSTGSGNDVSGRQTYTFEEMKAAVDAAHLLGKRIAIHSYGPEGARDAVRAGTDSVEHAVDIDDATLAEMVRRKIYYVPTIDHNRYYVEHREEFGYTAAEVAALDAYRLRNIETVRRAHKAGVRVAMGSDAVFTMFGENARELGWFVKAGMTPAEAVATATTQGAALLGMEKSLGAIAPGYFADIIAVEGDPLADINAVINGVRWVMKGGAVVVDRTMAR
jgi:imidazolonepropionase-like amidohydrolase